jgi:hypothetical protein
MARTAPPRTGLLASWVGRIAAAALRCLGATWRVREAGRDPLAGDEPMIGALWHAGLFAAAWRFRDRGVVIPVSRSRDGDRIASVLARLGYGPSPRGSSSRGAVAVLVGLIRAARAGRSLGVLCDGPRGPARSCKQGVLAAARATGLAIHPIGVAARPALAFGSWDRTLLPLPFARLRLAFGAPLRVSRDASREELESLRLALERDLDRLQAEAERALAEDFDSRGRRGAL